jgi:dynein heavy chain, axonemal
MNEKIEAFSMRCKKLPARLREYNAYKTLKSQIEDFQVVMPILQEFTKVLDAWEQIRIVSYDWAA